MNTLSILFNIKALATIFVLIATLLVVFPFKREQVNPVVNTIVKNLNSSRALELEVRRAGDINYSQTLSVDVPLYYKGNN